MSSSLRRNRRRLRVVPRQVCRRRCPPLASYPQSRQPANQASRFHLLPQRSWSLPETCLVVALPSRPPWHWGPDGPEGRAIFSRGPPCPSLLLEEAFQAASSGASPPEVSPLKPSRRLPSPCAMNPRGIAAVRVLGTSQRQKRSYVRQVRAHP